MIAEKTLNKWWGYTKFRSGQKEIITSILSGKDTVALMPTGGGKSICYQVPGLLLPGITIVVSPLISLMKDQVDALISRNISATYLAQTLSKQEINSRKELIRLQKYKFLYLSPERLRSKSLLTILSSIKVSLIVIDEAHCISVWGKTFRPSYRNIPDFIRNLNSKPTIMAVTATATKQTVADIINNLQMKSPRVYKSSFSRNIFIETVKSNSLAHHELELLTYLNTHRKHTGIIYVSSRAEAERLASKLNQLSSLLQLGKVGYYHAGMRVTDRQATQQLFLTDQLKLLVATTAFGMGIDKSNIGFVIHYHLAGSIENYYQEIGRAGRSGQQAKALLLYHPSHLDIQKTLLMKITDKAEKEAAAIKLRRMLDIIKNNQCISRQILSYFDEISEPCGNCNYCIRNNSPLIKFCKSNKYTLEMGDKWRQLEANKHHLFPYQILTDSQLIYFSLLKPNNEKQVGLIPGIGMGWKKLWLRKILADRWYNTPAHLISK